MQVDINAESRVWLNPRRTPSWKVEPLIGLVIEAE
jgi:hypothetical protein